MKIHVHVHFFFFFMRVVLLGFFFSFKVFCWGFFFFIIEKKNHLQRAMNSYLFQPIEQIFVCATQNLLLVFDSRSEIFEKEK